MKKILYFDTETTGLDPKLNDIIQIAGIVVVDGQLKEEFEFRCQPFDYTTVTEEALKTHGISVEMMGTYRTPQEIYKELTGIFGKYIDKYDKKDKFTPAGYNVRFDMEFLSGFFNKNGDVYMGSWLNWKMVDPLPLLHFLDFAGKISLPDYKLGTVCKHFGIEFTAHDALSDIKATRELVTMIYKQYFSQEVK